MMLPEKRDMRRDYRRGRLAAFNAHDAELRLCCSSEHKPADGHSLWDDRIDDVPGGGEAAPQREKRHREAVAVCRRCPLIEECRLMADYAAANRIAIDGVVGGLRPEQRPLQRCRHCGQYMRRFDNDPAITNTVPRGDGTLCSFCHERRDW